MRATLEAVGLAAELTPIGRSAGGEEAGAYSDADRDAVGSADATLRLGWNDAAPPAAAPSAATVHDLAWLCRPLGLRVRLDPCRAYAGNPWIRGGNIDIMLFGDGSLETPASEAEAGWLESAWGYARRHGRRRVCLVASGERSDAPWADECRRLASGFDEIEFEEVASSLLLERGLREPSRARDVLLLSGPDGDRIRARAAELVGGRALVPSCRFGRESFLLEASGAVGAIRGAGVLCEWLGEGARAARIERALAGAFRDGADEIAARIIERLDNSDT